MRYLICPILLLITAGPGCASPQERAVRDAFGAYQRAILADDGKAAAEMVDGRTLAYYAGAKKLALEASADHLRSKPLLDRLMVLRLRQEFDAAGLARLTPRALVAHAVSAGWTGKLGPRRVKLGKVVVRGDGARAWLRSRGKRMPFPLRLRREEGRWKIDLTSLIRAPGIETAMRRKLGRLFPGGDDALLQGMIRLVAKGRLKPDLWKPLQR